MLRTAYSADRHAYERFVESLKPRDESTKKRSKESVVIPDGFVYEKK